MTSRDSTLLNRALALSATALLLGGCELRQAMYDQPKYESYEASDVFDNLAASFQYLGS